MLQLIGHESEETALVIKHYPLHFGCYTIARFWVETKKSYGQRLMRQFLNHTNINPNSDPNQLLNEPSPNKWFKAKSSSFHDIVVMLIEENPTSIQFGMPDTIEFNFAGKEQLEVQGFSEYFFFNDDQRAILTKQLSTYRNSTYRTNFRNIKPAPWGDLELLPASYGQHIGRGLRPIPNESGFEEGGHVPAIQLAEHLTRQNEVVAVIQPPLPIYPAMGGINPLFAGEINNAQDSGNIRLDYHTAQIAHTTQGNQYSHSDAQIAAAELVRDTWDSWPHSKMLDDPDGWAQHKATRDNAYSILGLDIPGSGPVVPLNNSDLKRGG